METDNGSEDGTMVAIDSNRSPLFKRDRIPPLSFCGRAAGVTPQDPTIIIKEM